MLLRLILLSLTATSVLANQCNPLDSVPYTNIRTDSNETCFFPFMYNGVKYEDCQVYVGQTKAWCATTCNLERDKKFSNCLWRREQTTDSTCNNLVQFKVDEESATEGGKKCIFPYEYKGKCYSECYKEGGGRPWCSNIPSLSIDPNSYSYCISIDRTKASCKDLKLSSKRYHPQTDKGYNECQFPFYYETKGECFSDCSDSVSADSWCSTIDVFPQGSKNFSLCYYMGNMANYSTYLGHGLYTIKLDIDQSSSFHNGYLGITDNIEVSVIPQSNSKAPPLWEIYPQPRNSIIIRSIDKSRNYIGTTGNLMLQLQPMTNYNKNTRFVITPLNNSIKTNSYNLVPIVGTNTETGYYMGISSNGQLLKAPIQFNWIFEKYSNATSNQYNTYNPSTTRPSKDQSTTATTTTSDLSTTQKQHTTTKQVPILNPSSSKKPDTVTDKVPILNPSSSKKPDTVTDKVLDTKVAAGNSDALKPLVYAAIALSCISMVIAIVALVCLFRKK